MTAPSPSTQALHLPTGPRVSSAPPVLRVAGLHKRFPVRRSWREILLRPFTKSERATVLRDVGFDVHEAEIFGVLGPNGAGKTTLFKILATQLLPDGGSASVAGFDVVEEAQNVRRILTPVIADERSLYWRLSARENLELFATLLGLDPREAPERIDEMLRVVELDRTGEKMVGAFSSGMKQRLLIARALLARPRILLLDEPTRSLDPVSARRFREFLRREVVDARRCAIVLATHHAEEAFELCDRVAVLDRGHLIAAGTVPELAAQVREDRYRITLRTRQIEGLFDLFGEGSVEVLGEESPGWTRLAVQVPSGLDGAADALARILLAGIDVSRFERTELSLADLVDGLVSRGRREPDA